MAAKVEDKISIAQKIVDLERERFRRGYIAEPKDKELLDKALGYWETSSRIDKWADALDLTVQGPKKAAVKAAGASALGIAARKILSKVSKSHILDELFRVSHIRLKEPVKDFIDVTSGKLWSQAVEDRMKDPTIRKEMKRILNKFPDYSLDPPPGKGLELKHFEVHPHEVGALGTYNRASTRAKINVDPWRGTLFDPKSETYLPAVVGHELEHHYGEFIEDQVRRLREGAPVVFSKEQFDRLRDVFTNLVSSVAKDPANTSLGVRKELSKTLSLSTGKQIKLSSLSEGKVRKLLEDDKNLHDIASWYRQHGFVTEHAAMAFEKAAYPGNFQFGRLYANDPWYKITKPFTRTAVGLRDVGFHHELASKVKRKTFRKKLYGEIPPKSQLDAYIEWFGRQRPEVKKRLEKELGSAFAEAIKRGAKIK